MVIDNNHIPNTSQSFLEISERDRSISAPSLRDDLVSSPSINNFSNNEHVSREEAQVSKERVWPLLKLRNVC